MLLNINVCTNKDLLYINQQAVIVCIGDCNNREFIQSFNGVPASLYNPPIDAITANVDGDYNKFRTSYFTYLCTNEDVKEFTLAIIRTAIMGKEVILYLDPNEYDLYFGILAEYFLSNFGLRPGNPFLGIICELNDGMAQNIISYLYLNNEMPVDVFLRLYYIPFTEDIIRKLIYDKDMGYILRYNYSLEDYNMIFGNMRQRIAIGEKKPMLNRNYKIANI